MLYQEVAQTYCPHRDGRCRIDCISFELLGDGRGACRYPEDGTPISRELVVAAHERWKEHLEKKGVLR